MSARLHREVAEELLARVVAGQFPAGELLPKETDIADEFGVSRGTAREALRALDERGVSVVRHGRGAVVQPQARWDLLDPLVATAVLSTRRRRGFAGELAEARRVIESELAALAADRAGKTGLRALAERAAGGDADAVLEAVADLAGNRPLATIAAKLRPLTPRVDATQADIAALVSALQGGDGEAARSAVRRLLP